jgi:hypothetical protein
MDDEQKAEWRMQTPNAFDAAMMPTEEPGQVKALTMLTLVR